MTILSRLRRKSREQKQKQLEIKAGIIEHTSYYFEMTYLKFGKKLYMCLMAPDIEKAWIKAKSALHTYNGDKILDIRKLDASNLGKSLTWNRSGAAYSQYQNKRRLRTVYKKDKK